MSAAMDPTGHRLVAGSIYHESHGRVTRITYQALVKDADNAIVARCVHDHGHRTIEATAKCGRALWLRTFGKDGAA